MAKHTGYTYDISDSGDIKYGDCFFQAHLPPYMNIKPQDNHIQSSTVR